MTVVIGSDGLDNLVRMWRSGDTNEHPSALRSPSTVTTVVVTFGLVTVLLLGISWALLKPASGSVSSRSAPSAATEPTGPIAVARRRDFSELSEAEAQARQENLDQMAKEPNPFVTAIREVVGPEMTEDDLHQLSLEVNLLCAGSSPAEAQTLLIERGMTAAQAKSLIEVGCAIP